MVSRLSGEQQGKVLNLNGHFYATMDFFAYDGTSKGDQSDFCEPPSGWQIAPNTPEIANTVVSVYPWSTLLLHLSGGCAYGTSQSDSPGCLKKQNNFETKGKKVKPLDLSGYNRILITCSWLVSPAAPLGIGRHLFDTRDFHDCTVSCGGKDILCHRAVLSLSPVLKKMFESKMREGCEQRVEILEYEAHIIEMLVQFIYLGHAPVKKEDLPSMISVADKYGLEDMCALCATALVDQSDETDIVYVLELLRPFMDREHFAPVIEKLKSCVKNSDIMLVTIIKGKGGTSKDTPITN